MHTGLQFSLEDERELRKSPDERYIVLFNQGRLIIDSGNTVYNWSKRMQYPMEINGDYYHALDYGTLGVSYSELTDPGNLVWISFGESQSF